MREKNSPKKKQKKWDKSKNKIVLNPKYVNNYIKC